MRIRLGFTLACYACVVFSSSHLGPLSKLKILTLNGNKKSGGGVDVALKNC